jgi:lysophospholipid acyltransferase (LPLAT)-like uncharacterized protein
VEAINEPFSWSFWKKKFIFKLQVYIAYIVFRLLFLTLKVKVIDAENIEKAKAMSFNDMYINAFWHQQILSCLFSYEGVHESCSIAITSQSRDGDYLDSILSLFGHNFIRGSSSRGGGSAMLKVIKELKKEYSNFSSFSNAIDGPKGPILEVKPGIVQISRLAQVPVVPMVFVVSRYWQLSSWDKCCIPKPFATVYVAPCEPFIVDADLPKEKVSEVANTVRDIMLSKEHELRELYNIPEVKD